MSYAIVAAALRIEAGSSKSTVMAAASWQPASSVAAQERREVLIVFGELIGSRDVQDGDRGGERNNQIESLGRVAHSTGNDRRGR